MYDHSILVMNLSLQIGQGMDCDKTVLSIAALLHDIGKTVKADEETLRKQHAELSAETSKEFIENLKITEHQKKQILQILQKQGNCIEQKIIHDADIVAFFSDEQLQNAFQKWAEEKGLKTELKRKLDKFNDIQFTQSKNLAKDGFDKLSEKWKQ